MNISAVNRDLRTRRIKIFIFQLAQRAAVHGIGKVGAKGGNVKMLRSAANLLIRRKAMRSVG